jgi:hypothetical protein
MADANTELTLGGLHDAIEAQLAAAFPAFRTVQFYRDDESESLPTPALLLEMTEAEPAPDRDSGTGQWHAFARFEGRIIMSARSGAAKREIRKAATALATWLNLRRFAGVPTDECQVIACERDEFSPKLDRFEAWRVEWVQLVMLGESAWINDGIVPEELYIGFAPDIGAAHELDYTRVGGS